MTHYLRNRHIVSEGLNSVETNVDEETDLSHIYVSEGLNSVETFLSQRFLKIPDVRFRRT